METLDTKENFFRDCGFCRDQAIAGEKNRKFALGHGYLFLLYYSDVLRMR
jgi:hypothetical protein